MVAQWWGRGNRLDIERHEFARGGHWRYLEHSDHGSARIRRPRYREVTAPERFVRSFEWDGMPGHVAIEFVTLTDLGDGRTRINIVMQMHTPKNATGSCIRGCRRDWTRPLRRSTGSWPREGASAGRGGRAVPDPRSAPGQTGPMSPFDRWVGQWKGVPAGRSRQRENALSSPWWNGTAKSGAYRWNGHEIGRIRERRAKLMSPVASSGPSWRAARRCDLPSLRREQWHEVKAM